MSRGTQATNSCRPAINDSVDARSGVWTELPIHENLAPIGRPTPYSERDRASQSSLIQWVNGSHKPSPCAIRIDQFGEIISCSLAVGPGGAVLARGPYGEHAEALVVVEVEPRPPIGRGTEFARALEARDYRGPRGPWP